MKKFKSYPVWTKLYKLNCFYNIRFPLNQLYEDMITNYDILSNSEKYIISNKKCHFYFTNPNSITRSIFINKDFEYIKVGKQFFDRTKDNEYLKPYGEMTLARTYFMCLCKMIKFKCAEDVDVDSFVNEVMPVLRKNVFKLLSSQMAISRKVILVFLCLNKHITTAIIKRRN